MTTFQILMHNDINNELANGPVQGRIERRLKMLERYWKILVESPSKPNAVFDAFAECDFEMACGRLIYYLQQIGDLEVLLPLLWEGDVYKIDMRPHYSQVFRFSEDYLQYMHDNWQRFEFKFQSHWGVRDYHVNDGFHAHPTVFPVFVFPIVKIDASGLLSVLQKATTAMQKFSDAAHGKKPRRRRVIKRLK